MSIEKSYNEFIILHEKKIMTKDVDSVDRNINEIINRASSIIDDNKEIDEASVQLIESLNNLKKILNKYQIYEI